MSISYREKISYEVYDTETGNIVVIYDDEVTAASHAGILNEQRRLKETSEQEKSANSPAGTEQGSVQSDGAA